MKPSLTDCYSHLGFQVTESEDLLWVGFKAGRVHAIVKEVWNERPLTRSDAELFTRSSLPKTKGIEISISGSWRTADFCRRHWTLNCTG